MEELKTMQLKTNSNNLLKGLQQAVGTIKPNNTLPILDCFHLELQGNNLTITTSDLEVTTIVKLEVESVENGTIAVPHNTLLNLLKTFNNETITISALNNTLTITANSGEYQLTYDDANDYPNTPDLNEESYTVDGNVLNKAISKVLFATSNDELRPQFCGVYFDNGFIVATDAHKLVKVETNINADFILPKKASQQLKNLLPKDTNVALQYNQTNALFAFDNITIITRLVDGKYPNYEAVIPKENPNRLSINRQEFISVLKRMEVFANKQTNQIRLDLSEFETLISSEDVDYRNKAKETLNGVYSGQGMAIGVNAKFLVEMLNSLNCEEVFLDMSEPNKAILINGEEGVNMLVMPLMLNAK